MIDEYEISEKPENETSKNLVNLGVAFGVAGIVLAIIGWWVTTLSVVSSIFFGIEFFLFVLAWALVAKNYFRNRR